MAHYETLLGNKNAEKWTIDTARDFLQEAVTISSNDKDYDFIGELAFDMGTDKSTFNYLADKFKELKPYLTRIRNNCEVNCFRNGKKGKINTAMAIVNLKSNHDWTDRSHEVVEQQVITVKPKNAD